MTSFHNLKRSSTVFLLVAFVFTSSGCATLKSHEYATYGYKGTPEIHEGKRIVVIDVIGNIFGIFQKLILWNWKMKRHWIKEDTQQAIDAYLSVHGKELGRVSVELNRYAPLDAWRRLRRNKGVAWPYKYTFGLITFLIADVILINRLFGGDHYNPYSHTVSLFSDIPSVALHELGHAHDFSRRRYRGSYAFLYIVPFFNLYVEYKASQQAFEYIRAEKLVQTEVDAYKILYPAYGTYVGSYIISPILGAIAGHVIGRMEAHDLEEEIKLNQVIAARS